MKSGFFGRTRSLPVAVAALLCSALLFQSLTFGQESRPAKTPAKEPSAAVGNMVEPLSNGLKLTMTPDQVVKALGKPSTDDRSGGGYLGYRNFDIVLDPSGDGIWSLMIRGGVRLNCGIGIGNTKKEVTEKFKGGFWFGEEYDVNYLQYNLAFIFANGKLSDIRISPVVGHFSPYDKPTAK